MNDKVSKKKGITRRGFMKGAAMVAAASGLITGAPVIRKANTQPQQKKYPCMKITSVEIYLFENALLNTPDGTGTKDKPIICRINTNEGISGLGEAGISYGIGATSAFGMVKDLAEIIIGMDPTNTEKIWDIMQKNTFWGKSVGIMFSAGMSAIDIALWDIKSKSLGVPLYKMLGGKTRDSLRCYAAQLQFGWGREWTPLALPEEYAECAIKAVEEGYDCIKINPIMFNSDDKMEGDFTKILSRSQIESCYNRLAAVRDAIGPDIDIIVELHSMTDATSAVQLGKAIEDIGIYYYEEPVAPLNPDLMKEVRENVNFPIASGERIYTRWGYRPFLEMKALDIIQPDFCNCGGISEGKKICDMAHVYDISVQAHVAGSPVSQAVALHVETAIPNFIIHEHHVNYLNPNVQEMCNYNYQPVKGRYYVPDLPGIGLELSEAVIKRAVAKTIIK